MRRIARAGSLGVLLACSGTAVAQDELPPLSPPSRSSSHGGAAELPPAIESSTATGPPAVLAVPGVSVPRPNRSASTLPALEPAGPAAPEDLPPLVGPTEMPAPPSLAPNSTPAPSGPSSPPLTLESISRGERAEPSPPIRRDTPRGSTGGAARPRGFFGRLFAPPSSLRRNGVSPEEAITVEPRSDPAADAALKRRLESQLQAAYGDHLKSLEVRVVGRGVTVHARAARFWQRRALRRSLESFPALAGRRANIEVE